MADVGPTLDLTPLSTIVEIAERLQQRTFSLESPQATSGLICDAEAFSLLLSTAATYRPEQEVHWAGLVQDSIDIDQEVLNLIISGRISGDVRISANVGGDVAIKGSIGGNLVLGSDVELSGSCIVDGPVDGDVALDNNTMVRGGLFINDAVGENVVLRGTIAQTATLTGSIGNHVAIQGQACIGGNLLVRGQVANQLILSDKASVLGYMSLEGSTGHVSIVNLASVKGHCTIGGTVAGDVNLSGEIGGDLALSGQVTNNVTLRPAARVGGNLLAKGLVDGSVVMSGSSSVAGNASVSGHVGTQFLLSGQIGGSLALVEQATIGADFRINAHGAIAGDLRLGQETNVANNVLVLGGVQGRAWFLGHIGGTTNLRSLSGATPLRIATLAGSFGRSVTLDQHVDLSMTDFRLCPDLDRFRFLGDQMFASKGRTVKLADQFDEQTVPPQQMAQQYARLRHVFERQGRYSTAKAFRSAEFEVNRQAARESVSLFSIVGLRPIGEWLTLSIYKMVSGYGQAIFKTFFWLLALLLSATLVLAIGGVDLTASGFEHSSSSFSEWFSDGPKAWIGVLVFCAQTVVSFLFPTTGKFPLDERVIQLALRVLGPALVLQLILVFRSRLRR